MVFEPRDGERFLWQWTFDAQTARGASISTRTLDIALTANKDMPPRCQPGYATDLPSYQICLNTKRTIAFQHTLFSSTPMSRLVNCVSIIVFLLIVVVMTE